MFKFRFRVRQILPFRQIGALTLSLLFMLSIPGNLLAQHLTRRAVVLSPVSKAKTSAIKKSALSSNRQTDSGQLIGTPWTGAVGIAKTTAEIMELDSQLAGKDPAPPAYEFARPITDRKNLPQNPESLAIAAFPDRDPNTPALEPRAPQTPSTSFTAATLTDTNAFPPDTMGAAGPTQFLLAVNGRIRVFDKTGVIGTLNTTLNTFFNSVRGTASTNYPRVRFDRLSNRWFVTASTAAVTPNSILIAVSNNATINGATIWTFFAFQQNLVTPAGDANCQSDYPTLGIDANGLYIGVNQFCGTPLTFNSSAAFVVRKSSVTGGGPIVVTAFRNLTGGATGTGPFAPQGVDNYDPAATEGYFIGVDNAGFGSLIARRVTNADTTPVLSANISITILTTALPLTVRHQGNAGGANGQLDATDDRLIAAHIRNGRLWTSHNLGVDNNGIASGGGTRTRNGSRWYEIQNLNTATPGVVQSGTLFASSATNTVDDRNYWMPSVMVSGQGHMAMATSIAGTNEFINAATAGRLASDTPGTLQTPAALTSSTTAYNPAGDTGAIGFRRWGDYSYTSLDPCDDMTMWTVQEFCDATNSYGLRVVKLLAPPPATPASASPSLIGQGTSINVTINANSINGSAFFDPGNGFGCRLTASVNGGVVVNSVTYQNPTTVVLNLNTMTASSGAKNITITNPDGQTVTANGLLNVNNSCSYAIAPGSQNFTGSGGSGSVNVTAGIDCIWTAVSNDSWITVTSGANGSGNGTVNYSVAVNSTGSQRQGTITIAGQTFTVTQAELICTYGLSSLADFFDSNGGTNSVMVTAPSGCAWTAVSNTSWITISSGASGNGNGTVSFSVARNSGTTDRVGTMTIGGQTFNVTQYGTTCVTGLSPASASYGASGVTSSITVSAPSGCSRPATSMDGWVTIISGANGTGNGAVKYSVAANPTTNARSTVIVVGKKIHRITQAGGTPVCNYTISPTSQTYPVTGGSGSVTVTTTTGCNWTAVSNAAWITITSGASGSGSGAVNYTVASNAGNPSRSGTLTIAGRTFTVNQDGASGGCTYTLSPTTATYTASGGAGNFSVTTTAGCNWTAVSNDSWLTITSGSSGTGSGAVNYTVAVNPGTTERQGTITVQGQTFTVTQSGAASCTYQVSSTYFAFTKPGGARTITVTTGSSCNWTASSPVTWVTITSGSSGTGTGTVTISVSANPGSTTRQTTLTVAGKSVTVKQAGT
ncbi:MAG: BACON domain-containing carbohydrate-binding protein [Acidobacteriota bacterium]